MRTTAAFILTTEVVTLKLFESECSQRRDRLDAKSEWELRVDGGMVLDGGERKKREKKKTRTTDADKN